MPRIKGEDLRKVTLNLFESDVLWCQREWGQGYSEQIRMMVRNYVNKRNGILHSLMIEDTEL